MEKREAALEAALLDYVERYGLTDKARAAFRVMGKAPGDDGAGQACGEAAGGGERSGD